MIVVRYGVGTFAASNDSISSVGKSHECAKRPKILHEYDAALQSYISWEAQVDQKVSQICDSAGNENIRYDSIQGRSLGNPQPQ